MSIIKDKLSSRISWIVFILLVIQTANVLSSFTDVPRKLTNFYFILFFVFSVFLAPPVRPERFHSRQELKRYLQLVCLYIFSFEFI
jgi:hypothetical protein